MGAEIDRNSASQGQVSCPTIRDDRGQPALEWTIPTGGSASGFWRIVGLRSTAKALEQGRGQALEITLGSNEQTNESARPRLGTALGLVALFLLAFGLRWTHLQAAQASPYPEQLSFLQDSQYYAEWSREIAAGEWVGQHSFFMGPLYPYSLALVEPLMPEQPQGGYDYSHAYLLQAFFGCLTCLLLWALVRKLLGTWQAFLAGALAAVQPVFIYFDGLLMPSSQVLFTVVGTLSLLYLAMRRRRLMWWCVAGASIGLATLAKGPALLILPGVVLWILFGEREIEGKVRVQWAAGVVLSCLPVVGLATLHNHAADGDFVLVTSNAGNNLWIGNGPDASGAHAGVSTEFSTSKLDFYRFGGARPADEPAASEVSRILSARARAYMLDNPSAAAALFWRKFRMFWNAAEIGTTDQFEYFKRYSSVLRLPLGSFGLVVPLGLLGMLICLRRWRQFWPLYLVVVTQAGSYTAFFVLGRYRLATVACMIVFAVACIDWLLPQVRQRNLKGLGLSAIALILAALFVHWPVPGMSAERGFANQEYLLAQDASKRGQDPAQHYLAALSGNWREGDLSLRQRANAHLVIGDAALKGGKRKQAQTLYREALKWAHQLSEHYIQRVPMLRGLEARLQALDG